MRGVHVFLVFGIGCGSGSVPSDTDPPDETGFHCWAPMPWEGIPAATDNPEGIRLGPDGALYVADFDGVYRIDPAAPDTLTPFASDPSTTNLQGLGFDADGDLLVASRDRNAVVRFDGTSGALIDVFAETGFDLPNTPRLGPDGAVYISSRNTAEIWRFEADGSGGAVFASDPLIAAPEDFDFGPDGTLYVAAREQSVVVRFDASGALIDTFAAGPEIDSPEGLSFHDDGSIWVNSRDSEELVVFEPEGSVRERIPMPSRPIGLTLAGCNQAVVTLREPGLVLPIE